MDTPFDILRIDRDADEADIERAYRERVMETHPDHGGSAREFQRVTAAYEELTSGHRDGECAADRVHVEDRPRRTESRVEYFNYEVLEDHEWKLDDEALFEKASAEGLSHTDYGQFLVHPHESLLQAAENRGFSWPFACRGGACANCAVAVTEGELSQPVNHILPSEMVERGIRLSCVGEPTTDEVKVVYNVKHLTDLDELRLPPHPFDRTRASD